jgi:hypothetical protein
MQIYLHQISVTSGVDLYTIILYIISYPILQLVKLEEAFFWQPKPLALMPSTA